MDRRTEKWTDIMLYLYRLICYKPSSRVLADSSADSLKFLSSNLTLSCFSFNNSAFSLLNLSTSLISTLLLSWSSWSCLLLVMITLVSPCSDQECECMTAAGVTGSKPSSTLSHRVLLSALIITAPHLSDSVCQLLYLLCLIPEYHTDHTPCPSSLFHASTSLQYDIKT